MKTKFFAAALAVLTLATAGIASAQDYRGGPDRCRDYRYDDFRGRLDITVRKDGRTFTFERGDRMFYRLLDRPFNFQPGMTYSYTDRCNRNGCIAFVFDGRHRRPIDRIFAPHLTQRGYAWRQARDFDRSYNRFGNYDRDERGWTNDDDRAYRQDRDRRDDDWDRLRDDDLDGGPRRR